MEDVELEDLDKLTDDVYGTINACTNEIQIAEATQLLPETDYQDIDYDTTSSKIRLLHKLHGIVAANVPVRSFGDHDHFSGEAADDIDSVAHSLRIAMCRFAVRQNHLELLKHCYASCQSSTEEESWSIICLAISYSRPEAFDYLMDRHHKSKAKLRSRALECAAYHGREDMMETLIAEMDHVDGSPSTHPLTAAVVGRQIGAVRLLLRCGAVVNVQDRAWMGATQYPTLLSAATDCSDPTFAKALVAAGASLRDENPKWDTLGLLISANDIQKIVLLVDAAAEVGESVGGLEDVLQLAVSQGHCDLAEFVLQAGANPNAEETKLGLYGSLFQWACDQGHEAMVKIFIRYNVDINRPKRPYAKFGGQNPLHAAVCSGSNPAVVDLLRELGAVESDAMSY